MSSCRCGWNGEGEHPCHGRGYFCRQPAKLRFYGGKVVGLSGVQMKVQASETWACDGCWENYPRQWTWRPAAVGVKP